MKSYWSRPLIAGLLILCSLSANAVIVSYALADNCPTDRFALWTGKHLHGANIFQGRNPGGAANGIGDGNFRQSDFDELRQAGANFVQLSHAGTFEEAAPYALDSVALAALDLSVQRAMAAGLYVVIAFRSGPGRNENTITDRDGLLVEKIWTVSAARDAWVNMLKHSAEHFRENPAVIGYSIMVEPNAYARHGYPKPADFYAQYAGTLNDVNGLYALATAAIREVDADVPILLEPDGFGNIEWLPYITITGDERTVYTAHDYTPFDYTHERAAGATYPGNYDLDSDGNQELVDKAFLASLLDSVTQFGQTNSVPVALTEFGVHRTANNASTYLNDRIDLQNAIGSWAVWTWQPAGFDDRFSVHDSSEVHAALVAAWSTNCTPVFEKPSESSGVLTGRSLSLERKRIKGVMIRVNDNTITSGNGGRFAITLPVGPYALSATFKSRRCLIGSLRGPKQRSIEVKSDRKTKLNVFCRKR